MKWITALFLGFWQVQAMRVGIPPDVFIAKYLMINYIVNQFGYKLQKRLLKYA